MGGLPVAGLSQDLSSGGAFSHASKIGNWREGPASSAGQLETARCVPGRRIWTRLHGMIAVNSRLFLWREHGHGGRNPALIAQSRLRRFIRCARTSAVVRDFGTPTSDDDIQMTEQSMTATMVSRSGGLSASCLPIPRRLLRTVRTRLSRRGMHSPARSPWRQQECRGVGPTTKVKRRGSAARHATVPEVVANVST